MLAAASTVLTVSLALALAYGLNARALSRPGLTRAVLLLPLVAPPVLMATTTLMLFGRRGLITSELLDRTLGLIDADHVNIYGPAGILIAQALAFLPAALIVLDNGFRGADARLSEAASGLGASYAAVLGRVVLPLGYPALKRAIVLVFIFSLTDFSNPMLLGGGFPVLAEVIYDQIIAYRNMQLAAAICVILLIPPLLLYVVLELAGGRRGFVAAGVASTDRPPVPAAVRRVLGAIAVTIGIAVLMVYATLVLGAFTRIWGVDWGLTLAHFRPGSTAAGSGLREVGDSLRLALVAAPVGGVLAVLIAYVVERLRPPGANIIFLITLLPAILPGIVFGIGYILAFNAPFGLRSLSLSGGFAILVLNVVFGNLFVGVLAGRAALQRLDRSVDEAAEGLGAGLGARLWLVVLPLLRVPLMLGALYVFIDALTTLSSVIFLVSGDYKLAAISIFNDANSSDFGPAAAKSVALLVLALAAMAALSAIERRTAIRPRQERIIS
ncbi:ABC transporter permease [Tistrella mobilis]|uniref:ABC transporter permease n=1 Tax=Tistrella mobilis TaxID=171437 RepID=UPI003557F805